MGMRETGPTGIYGDATYPGVSVDIIMMILAARRVLATSNRRYIFMDGGTVRVSMNYYVAYWMTEIWNMLPLCFPFPCRACLSRGRYR